MLPQNCFQAISAKERAKMNKDEQDNTRDEALGIYTTAELQDRREMRAVREYQRKQAERESLEK